MTRTERLLVGQWRQLRAWLESEDVLARGTAPSGLGEWTVRDLVAHLGYGLHMVAEVGPAPEGTEPLDLPGYVARYAAASQQIASATVALADTIEQDTLLGLDRLAVAAWSALASGLPDVVLGRRGPLRQEDYLRTRLVELVVHGDDLHRTTGGGPVTPLLPEAVAAVAEDLAAGYRTLLGRSPQVDDLTLVRLATGRERSSTWPSLLS